MSSADNFCFPIRDLENDHIKLTSFVIKTHAQQFYDACSSHPELFAYIPFGPCDNLEELIDTFLDPWGRAKDKVLYAVLAKDKNTSTQQLAGVLGFLDASTINLSLEIGAVITLPAFQRTHVTSNAVGLLLQYCFQLTPQGLGLRRVQWKADATNNASVNFATRFGFVKEGVQRWERVFAANKGKKGNGLSRRPGDPREDCPGRDTALFGLTWDEWDNGGKEKVEQLMKPRQKQIT